MFKYKTRSCITVSCKQTLDTESSQATLWCEERTSLLDRQPLRQESTFAITSDAAHSNTTAHSEDFKGGIVLTLLAVYIRIVQDNHTTVRKLQSKTCFRLL